MPIPLILGGIAAVVTAAGIAKGISNTSTTNEVTENAEMAKKLEEQIIALKADMIQGTQEILAMFVKMELETLKSFQDYYALTDRIKDLPKTKFRSLCMDAAKGCDAREIKLASSEAVNLLNAIEANPSGVNHIIAGLIADSGEDFFSDKTIDDDCLEQLLDSTGNLQYAFGRAKIEYCYQLDRLSALLERKDSWENFHEGEKGIIEMLDLLVCLLYKTANIKLLLKNPPNEDAPQVNNEKINEAIHWIDKLLEKPSTK